MPRRKRVEEPEEEIEQASVVAKSEPLPVISISEPQWQQLWTTFNANKTETIRVRKNAIASLISDLGQVDGLVAIKPNESSDTVLVNRAVLFKFLLNAGREYGKREKIINGSKK